MKTIKMSLANMQGKLSRAEMKNIMAGSGGLGNDGICMSQDGAILCTNDRDRADAFAGSDGWWCCNFEEAINYCGPLM